MPVNKQVLTPDAGAPGGLRPDEPGADRVLPARAGDRLRRSPSRASAASASPCSTSAATPRWCCATSPPTCRRSRSSACRTIMKDLVMIKRGLILMVGATGSGKSTSLAAMINYRNENLLGPHRHHRGPDRVPALATRNPSSTSARSGSTPSRSTARCASAMRAAPDVILIGEIRDRETMEAAITFAGTGHLVLATLHANNAPRRSTASSTCSRATSTRRSSWTCRSTCGRSCRSAWCWARTASACAARRGACSTRRTCRS